MFKDYDKYLSTSLKVYLFVLIIIFILKLVGLDYFGISLDNPTFIKISDLMKNNLIIKNSIFMIPLIISQYITLSIALKDNSRKMKVYNIITIPILFVFQCYKIKLFGNFSFLIEILYFIVLILIYNKRITKDIFKRLIRIIIYTMLVQIISILTRFRYSLEYIQNVIANLILNLDYIIMLIIIYKLYFRKGVNNKWNYQEEVSSSLQKLIHLKKYQKKSQKHSQNKEQTKLEKITNIIYIVLYALWNLFTLFCVVLIGKLNNTLVECIFIIFSFWISKSVFGKPFHLKNMMHCFIVSNLTYYVLNRVTTPLGISIIIPILLGVGLSYVTSKLVKKSYKPLYRGMSEELFEETILKVEDKNSLKYKICYEFYIKKKSVISLSLKYNYTESGIRKIKDRVNEKIKKLN